MVCPLLQQMKNTVKSLEILIQKQGEREKE